jgi:DNA processing protein
VNIHELDATTHPELFARLTLDGEAPARLWARGNLDALTAERPALAVTGSRASTGYGEHMARELVNDLSADVQLITGAAYGIEGAAARAALACGSPVVIVAANGADRAYPAGHAELIERVTTAGGVILTENEPGSAPTRARFQRRGQLMAALAAGTVIVEAGYRSGTLNTAATAHRLGRAVGAVPGPCTSPASSGAHRLIRDGIAAIVTSADDVRALLAASDGR